jgi:hypothetical protein
MNSFVISKTELVVLFDLICNIAIPTGITNLPEISDSTQSNIIKLLMNSGLINEHHDSFLPGEKLNLYFASIMDCQNIMAYNLGNDKEYTFNTTLFPSDKGVVSILDVSSDDVQFIKFESFDELMIFLPVFNENSDDMTNTEYQYLRYVVYGKKSTLFHKAMFDSKIQTVNVYENLKYRTGKNEEQEFEVSSTEYYKLVKEKLKGMCHVVSY